MVTHMPLYCCPRFIKCYHVQAAKKIQYVISSTEWTGVTYRKEHFFYSHCFFFFKHKLNEKVQMVTAILKLLS